MGLGKRYFEKAAERLGCEVAAIEAVARVESAGGGFTTFEGQRVPKVLFERHVFYQRVRIHHSVKFARELQRQVPGLCQSLPGGYKGGTAEHDRLSGAVALLEAKGKPRDAALESASYGAFQIMGYHWEALGYESLQAFINAMWESEEAHLDAFVRFIEANGLGGALQEKDWAAFAVKYNGPAYRRHGYHLKMEREYARALTRRRGASPFGKVPS